MTQEMLNSDSYEYLRNCKKDSFQFIHTDPPYQFASKTSLNRGGGFYKEGGKGNYDSFKEVKEVIGVEFNPITFLDLCKSKMTYFNGCFWTNKHLLLEYIGWAIKHKFHWEILVWVKDDPSPLFGDCYMPDKEYCIYIREKGAYWNNKNQYRNYFTWYMQSKGSAKTLKHPTMKPIAMVARTIINSTRVGEVVFDGFGGSGTTAAASAMNDRGFVICETEKQYFEIIKERISLINKKKNANN